MSNRLLKITAEEWRGKAREANYHARELAKVCGVSMRTLERHLPALLGKCPQSWLDAERMRLARERLIKGSSVKETAASLAFKTPEHFSRMFKQHHGHPPRQQVSRNNSVEQRGTETTETEIKGASVSARG